MSTLHLARLNQPVKCSRCGRDMPAGTAAYLDPACGCYVCIECARSLMGS